MSSSIRTPVGGNADRPPSTMAVDWSRCGRTGRLLAVVYYRSRCTRCWSTGRSDQARPVDAIVVMGAAQYDGRPSPQLAARLDHVVDLWPARPRRARDGDRRQPARRPLHRGRGVGRVPHRPGRAGGRDPAGGGGPRRTNRSRASPRCCTSADLSGCCSSADPYHALRSRLIAEELGSSPTCRRPTSRCVARRAIRRELDEAVGVAVGRIIGFDRLSRSPA